MNQEVNHTRNEAPCSECGITHEIYQNPADDLSFIEFKKGGN